MSRKKKNRTVPEENKVTSDYYKLHTSDVDDLVTADESNSPEVSEEELAKYKSGSKFKIPEPVRIVLLKMWFPGSVCFFIYWGLSAYITARLDLLFLFGMVLGIVTDLLTNSCLRFLAKTAGSNDRWMMFPEAKYSNLFFNIIYAMVLLACVTSFYNVLNLILLSLTGGDVYIGVEPILFAIVYTGFDMLLISAKHLLFRIVADAKRTVGA